MFSKTKMALAAAIIVGAASTALASGDTDRESGGFQVQTWQDIQQARQNIQKEIQSAYHMDNVGSAYGFVSPTHKPASRAKSQRDH
jgi:hypothetical protein